MKYFSMFSGIGGFERGINESYLHKHEPKNTEQTNGTSRRIRNTTNDPPLCIGYSEIDKYAIQIYEKNFKGHKNYGNARDIVPKQLPGFDLLVGGFPCQAFSIAGRRGGFDDTRGTLFFEIARVLKHKRPRYFLLENVKGLLSHDSGKTFQTILKVCSDIGYRVQWQVLNSKDFGVPQNRERVFIIGHLGGQRRPEVFPLRSSGQVNAEVQREQGEEKARASCLGTRYGQRWADETYVRTNKPSAQEGGSKPNGTNSIGRKAYSDDKRCPLVSSKKSEEHRG
jgi:DNA-cytosine methyltransferase